MKHKNFLIIIFILLGLAITLFTCNSCNTDNDGDGVLDKKDKCPDVYAKTKDGCPEKEKEISSIHFYIETSASMNGYFQKDAEFKTIISDLTSKIEKNIKPIDIWFAADTTLRYTKSTQQFSSDIATTKIADQKGSQLHKIIADIIAKNDSNDVTLLVSDCILSFPNEAIRKDKEINKTEAPNSLKNGIFSTFSDLKKKGLATSIYAFNSSFYGTYYNYQNVPTDYKKQGTKRPFYIWVIADNELLAKFNSKLSDITTFKPEKSLHFGFSKEPITKYDIIPQIERKGNWMKTSSGIKDIEIKKSDTLQFSTGLNLELLPEYANDIKYLQDNLVLTVKGCEATFEVKEKSTVDKTKLKSEPQIKLFENASHIIIFKINSMNLSEAKIQITLPLKYDTWYLDWSCPDDKDISNAQNKTFAFEHLIKGVNEAYETKNKNYIDFSITLNKK